MEYICIIEGSSCALYSFMLDPSSFFKLFISKCAVFSTPYIQPGSWQNVKIGYLQALCTSITQ